MSIRSMAKGIGRERKAAKRRTRWINLVLIAITLAVVAFVLWFYGTAIAGAQGVPAPAVPAVQPQPPQTWFTITQENAMVSLALPAGTTYRVGDPASGCWSASETLTAATSFVPFSMTGTGAAQFPFTDPCPGITEELDVLETAAPQTVTVAISGSSAVAFTIDGVIFEPSANGTVTVPALAPAAAVPVSHVVTLAILPATLPQATPDWFGLFDLPASGANRGYEGTEIDLTIDGVAMVCDYVEQSGGVFTLSCTAAAGQ